MAAQDANEPADRGEHEEPVVFDKRRIDPVTGQVRQPEAAGDAAEAESAAQPESADPGPAQSEPAPDGDAIDEELAQLLTDAPQEQTLSADAQLAAERLLDLQRLTAEYANYRRRTEQEKLSDREATTAEVLRALLPVLDDLDRAEQHGDLPSEGAVTVITSKLRSIVERLGLVAYGEKGDPFDPKVHEAIAQLPSPQVQGETVADVVERGYRLGERTVRVAKVAVFVPAE